MTDTFRAMCAELVELSAPVDSIPQLTERLQKLNELADRARALLDQPEAEGPSERELVAVELALWDKYRTKGWGGGEFMYDNDFSYALEEYRAVLARWGRPAAQSRRA